jgi:hypothetical protein
MVFEAMGTFGKKVALLFSGFMVVTSCCKQEANTLQIKGEQK